MNDTFDYAAGRRKWNPFMAPVEFLLGLLVVVVLPMVLLDLSGLVLEKRNPSSMAIQLVARGRAEGMSDKVTVFCQGAHEFVGEQELASLRSRITPKVKTVLLQLELPTAPTQQAAREAHAPKTRQCEISSIFCSDESDRLRRSIVRCACRWRKAAWIESAASM